MTPRARHRRRIGWELVTCGLRGHCLPAADVAALRPQDWPLGEERDGVRWCRCLRCDSWSPLSLPTSPVREHPPDRAEIEIPPRGQALRDRIVLRLIALDRVLHFLVLGILGIAVLALAGEPRTARGKFTQALAAIQRALGGGPVQTQGHVGIVGELDKVFSLQTGTLHVLGAVLLGYALLEGLEAVGLWLIKRWAEYLTFLATTILLPLEVYEVVHRVSALKVIGFLINLAIVVYLVWAKRLFGLRGGGAVDERRRAADVSWETIERTAGTPPPAPSPVLEV